MQVHAALQSHFRATTEALESGLVHEVMAGCLFRPQQRLLLWCGGLRPSDLLCWARIAVSLPCVPALLVLASLLSTRLCSVTQACFRQRTAGAGRLVCSSS